MAETVPEPIRVPLPRMICEPPVMAETVPAPPAYIWSSSSINPTYCLPPLMAEIVPDPPLKASCVPPLMAETVPLPLL